MVRRQAASFAKYVTGIRSGYGWEEDYPQEVVERLKENRLLDDRRIAERIAQFGGKLYLEFGGKLFDDYHASRVLPGFAPDSKVKMLLQLKDQAEIVITISADDKDASDIIRKFF